VGSTGSISNYIAGDDPTTYRPNSAFYGIRPSINLKSTIGLAGGTGTVTDPYIIKGDNSNVVANTTLLNTRQSGEYVKIENDTDATRVFRIVDTEIVNSKLTTKLVLNDYVKENGEVLTKTFSASYGQELWTEVSATNPSYWRGYLNTTWLGTLDTSMLEKGVYYFGNASGDGGYKRTVCQTVSSNISVRECIANGTVVSKKSASDYVGLLRTGEMFATQLRNIDTPSTTYLITPYGSYLMYITTGGSLYYASLQWTSERAASPTINLTSTVVIKSGTGLENDPFIVGLA